jgi:hypothetical protein
MKLTQEARKFKPNEKLRWPNLIFKTRRPGKADETKSLLEIQTFDASSSSVILNSMALRERDIYQVLLSFLK